MHSIILRVHSDILLKAHLQESLWSAHIELSPKELKEITEAALKITVVGDRYTGQSAQQVRN